jgi:hypothetical protein
MKATSDRSTMSWLPHSSGWTASFMIKWIGSPQAHNYPPWQSTAPWRILRRNPPTGATYNPCSQPGILVLLRNSTHHNIHTVHHGDWDGQPPGICGHWYLQTEKWLPAGVACLWGLQCCSPPKIEKY